jgi:hypothetical protein
MREVGLILFAILVPGITEAAGLKSFLAMADPRAVSMISIIFGIIACGILGSVAKALMGIMNVGKYGALTERACYIVAFGLFVGLLTDLLSSVTNFLLG